MTTQGKFSANFTVTNVGYCCFEGVTISQDIEKNTLEREDYRQISNYEGAIFQFHKWAPYPGTTEMNLNNCIVDVSNLPKQLPLTNEEIIQWWTSPRVYNDDGTYKGGAYAVTNLPLCDNEWAVGCSIENNYKIKFDLIEKGIRDPKTKEIIPGSDEWCWFGEITTEHGIYKTWVCYCRKTFEETGRIIPMPQEAYDVLLGVDNVSDGNSTHIMDRMVLKLGVRAYNSKTDIGGAYVSGAGETKTYADHGKLSKSVKRAIEEELGINFSNVKKARIFCLGIRDTAGRDSRYYNYTIMSKSSRELIQFGHPRYSKTTVFFVLVEFNDEDKKDLPHTDVEEIQSTAWVKLSDALLIPSYKFFIPENSTYLLDVSRLLYDYQNMEYNQFNELYNGKDLEIENDD
jgi:hypothetical protein